ncbi:hypothetical protein F5Y13DRAFT_152276 [Hypoxylon sp. FL1857]|nr:hypothetical protein F5Y13DRAFT_152276 [Hypoxylon sp. FL1857]
MRAVRPRNPSSTRPRQLPPVVVRTRHGERSASHSKGNPGPSRTNQPSKNPTLRKPESVRIEDFRTRNVASTSREVQPSYHNGRTQHRHHNEEGQRRRYNGNIRQSHSNGKSQQRHQNRKDRPSRFYEHLHDSHENVSKGNTETIPTTVDDRYPVREHKTNEPIDLTDLVEEEEDDDDEIDYHDDYEVIYRGRPISRSPQQPIPLRKKQAFKGHGPQASNSSLVRRITDAAETVQIAGYPNQGLKKTPGVPKIREAPKVPHWRVDTPHPEAAARRILRSQSAIHLPSSSKPVASPLRTAPATSFIRTSPSLDSLKSALKSSPGRGGLSSHDIVPIPRQRSSGLQAYRERGVPSPAFVKEENGEDQHQQEVDAESPSMLVSISTPSPTYSCAIQTCYCTADEPDSEVCPSCLERRRLERELSMKWI